MKEPRILRGRRAKPNFPEPTLPEPHGVSTDLVLALPAPPAHRSQAQHQQPLPASAAVAAVGPAQQQASFANWLVPASSAAAVGVALAEAQHQRSTSPAAPAPPLFLPQKRQRQVPVPLPPFTQFFYPATAAAGTSAAAAATANPAATAAPVPGAFVLKPQNVQMPPATTDPASSALSSTEPIVDTSLSLSLSTAPTQHRELPMAQATAGGVSDGAAVVADNFGVIVTDEGASSSSSAAAAPPPPGPRLTLMLQFDLPDRGGSGGAQ